MKSTDRSFVIFLQKENCGGEKCYIYIYIYQTRKTGVERYKFEYTMGQLCNFTDICAEKCSQIVNTVTSLLLFQF
jgi:hypothetical protein